ncbi:MAG: TadE/TadG family type IV pilus assembly protein [Myxococcota bacterium]
MRRRGANALEFALLLPVFVAFVGASMHYSWLLVEQANVRGAVAEGCRAGSLHDPGIHDSHADALLAAASAAIQTAYESEAGSCKDCVATATLEGDAPNRVLRCQFTVPFSGVVPWVQDHSLLSDEVVVRLEFQRSAR